MGGLFLAAATSLPDFASTLTAAIDGHAELAMRNVMGSMAVNIAFLSVGDLLYRKANLEQGRCTKGQGLYAVSGWGVSNRQRTTGI